MEQQRIYSLTVLGQTFKRARTDSKLTQKDLAELTGIAQPTISDIETGQTDVRMETLLKLASALKLDILIASGKPSKDIW